MVAGLVVGGRRPAPHLCTAGMSGLEYPQPVHRESGCWLVGVVIATHHRCRGVLSSLVWLAVVGSSFGSTRRCWALIGSSLGASLRRWVIVRHYPPSLGRR